MTEMRRSIISLVALALAFPPALAAAADARQPIGVQRIAESAARPDTPGDPGSLPIAATAALLAATPTAGKAAILRLGYYAAGDAPPVLFTPLSGTCAANRLAADGGGCVDTAAGDGNAWKGQLGPFLAFEEFGARGDGATDDSAAINAAIVYQCANRSWEIRPRLNAIYAVARPIVDHCGARVMGGLGRVMAWQRSVSDAPRAPFIVKWLGGNRSAPFYLADIGAAANPTTGMRVYNGLWAGVLWDCNGATGCGGALVHSVAKGRYNMGAWEPRPALYTAAASNARSNRLNLTSTTGLATGMSVEEWTDYQVGKPGVCPHGNGCPGSTVLPLTATAGLAPGMVVLSGAIPANTTIASVGAGIVNLSQPIGPRGVRAGERIGVSHLPTGAQIWTVDSGTQVGLTANIQAPFGGGESIAFGGEGIRFDVTQDLGEVNDTQDNVIELTARNASGAAIQGPGIVLGAVNISGQGSAGRLVHYGNFSGNQVPFLECSYIFNGNACVVFGDQDHNTYGFIHTALSAGVVATGQLEGYARIGGPARYFSIDSLAGNFAYEGSELGFAAPGAQLGVDLAQVVQGSALAGVTAAALGAGNHGIRWRFDRSNQWQLNDAVTTTPGGSRTGVNFFSSYSNALSAPRAITASASCRMMGLGSEAKIEPRVSGRVEITIAGSATVTGARGNSNGNGSLQLRAGTDKPPANGAAATGAQLSNALAVKIGSNTPVVLRAILNAPATTARFPQAGPIWADLCAEAPPAGAIGVAGLTAAMIESN